MTGSKTAGGLSGSWRHYVLGWLLFFVCTTVLYRHLWIHHFNLLTGDRHDAVISTAILEHWWNVFRGYTGWSDTGYFYPYARTIAQTDGYFLTSFTYIPFRAIGLDPFISAEFCVILTKAIGFWGMYFFATKAFGLKTKWAYFAAVLFTLNNAMTIHSSRVQLATVAYVPFVSLLIWLAIKAFMSGESRRFYIYGGIAMAILGAWCLTCLYIAWFFVFYCFVVSIVLLVLNRRSSALLWTKVRTRWKPLVCVGLVGVLSLVPFIYAYYPKSKEVGVRSYESVMSHTVPLSGLFQVGHDNYLYGKIYNLIIENVFHAAPPNGEYYNTGIAFLMAVLFFAGIIYVFRFVTSPLHRSMALAALLTWVCVINFNGYSLWALIYYTLPGAKALNVVSAYQIVLSFPFVLFAVYYLSKVQADHVLKGCILFILVIGELNSSPVSLDRAAEVEKIRVPSAPADCRAFYVSGWSWQTDDFTADNNYYTHNVSALMIAQIVHRPTLGGIASFSPPDWCFACPNEVTYDSRVLSYARRHGVTEGLYKLNLETKQWSKIPASAFTPPEAGAGISFRPDFSDTFFSDGWSYSERQHRWSSGESSALSFTLKEDAAVPSRVQVKGFTLGPQQAEIKFNGTVVFNGPVSQGGWDDIGLPQNLWVRGVNQLQFKWSEPRIPGGKDTRRLAFAVQSVAFKE